MLILVEMRSLVEENSEMYHNLNEKQSCVKIGLR